MSINTLHCSFKDWQPSEGEWDQMLALLVDSGQQEEKERILKYRRPAGNGNWLVGRNNDTAKASIVGRLLMTLIAHRNTGLPYRQLVFKRTESGKPYLENSSSKSFQYNVSHDGDYTVISTTDCDQYSLLGIDVMKCEIPRNQKMNDFFDSLSSCFTTYEWNVINSFKTDQEKIRSFFRNWCLKESYVKAIGIGVELPLETIEFHIDDDGQTAKTYLKGVIQPLCHIQIIDLPNNHILAICTINKDSQVPTNNKDSYIVNSITPSEIYKELNK